MHRWHCQHRHCRTRHPLVVELVEDAEAAIEDEVCIQAIVDVCVLEQRELLQLQPQGPQPTPVADPQVRSWPEWAGVPTTSVQEASPL